MANSEIIEISPASTNNDEERSDIFSKKQIPTLSTKNPQSSNLNFNGHANNYNQTFLSATCCDHVPL